MNFLSTLDSDLDHLIASAMRFKAGDDQSRPLSGKSVALVFFNPSLRTRASMQVGIYELGEKSRKLCFALPGKDRPTEFSSAPGSEHILVTFERVK